MFKVISVSVFVICFFSPGWSLNKELRKTFY